jgi:lysophospholipase L1-like esterase
VSDGRRRVVPWALLIVLLVLSAAATFIGIAQSHLTVSPGPEPSTSVTSPTTSTLPTSGSTVDSIAPSQATEPVYLALGDSAPLWNGNESYPNYIAAHLRSSIKGLELVNLSVSGETSGSMLSGSSGASGSQQQRAVSFLQAHRGSVVLITIDIGGNDVLACGSGTNTATCLQQVETTMASNLTTILSQLRDAAGPSVLIVGMTYYDPYLGDWLAGGSARSTATGSVPYLVTLNNLLAKTYGTAGDRVADVQGAFQSTDLSIYVSSPWGQVPVAVEQACTLLDMSCGVGEQTIGTDPSPAGAKVIAQAFNTTIGVPSAPG